jgi:phospholipid/cholesterol/gamma-HCH transport system substrate-binding protein
MVISQGSNDASLVADVQQIASIEPVETDAIIASLQTTADNAAIISNQLAEVVTKVNNGKGIVGRLIQDSTMAENIDQTIVSLKKSSKGLNENMNAAKSNFLLRGYFKKEEKAAQKTKDSATQKKAEEQKTNDKMTK